MFNTPGYSVLIATFQATASLFGGGSGTLHNNPYQIQTLQHLRNIEAPCHDSNGKYYKLAADITAFTGSNPWEPIDHFYGTLDGDGKKIKYLTSWLPT